MMTMPPQPADQNALLRQQLILAQVRIMELEDASDALTPRLATLEQLLSECQALADQKINEVTHLNRVRHDLQAQFEHLRHMQHVTNEALEETRKRLADCEKDLQSGKQIQSDLLIQLGHANNQLQDTSIQLHQARAEMSRQHARIAQLDAERTAMKTSRSWRWTAWLRSIERAFPRRSS